MTEEIVGRDVELATVRALVTRVGGELSALVLAGEAGIGKSTLWAAAVDEAQANGLQVVRARPAEAEAHLALAGLGDLLEPVADEVLPRLTAPQRRAVEVALVLADHDDDVVEPRALGVAVRSVLDLLAADGPVVVAVDDAQWLDDATAVALAFALRRLADVDVRLLLSRRDTASAVEDALTGDRRPTVLPVMPLSLGALHALLHRRLGRTFPRPTMQRLHDASGGNPLYALELARALERSGAAPGALDPLPLPPTLDRLLGERLQTLPDETRQALLVAAVAGSPTTAVLERVGVSTDALSPAVAAQVLERGVGTVRFTHPLLGSAVVAQAAEGDRRVVHRRLAQVLDDPVARAVHLAAAVDGPDVGTAEELERAALTARSRGAPALAAELAEAAARATPDDQPEDRGRRSRAAARDHLSAGSSARALALARELVAHAPAGRQLAEALGLLADLEELSGESLAADEHRREALDEAAGAPRLQSWLHEQLALGLRITETLGAALPHARDAVRLAEQVGDVALVARASATYAVLLFNSGDPAALELAERAVSLASADPESAGVAGLALGHCLVWSGRLDEARRVVTGLLDAAEDRDEPGTANALWYLALVEERAGRLALARSHAERSRELTSQYGLPGVGDDPGTVLPLLRVAMLQGEHDLVRDLADRALPVAQAHGGPSTGRSLLGALATLERWEGRPAEALARFEEVAAAQQAAGFTSAMAVWTPEHVEALVEVDRVDDARAMVDAWADETARAGHVWTSPHVLRCRGLLAAAAGDSESAVRLFTESVRAAEDRTDPVGRARALLNLGQANRRLKQKRAAREAFEAAVAQLDDIGAAWWAQRARSELGTIGGRTRVEGLTPAEQRVADLVAEGKTNREVASMLFLGESTVEKHLSRIYAKLGVRSRTELSRRMG
jgi:DNA-binding CsgD family transcriptional regulator